MIGSFSNPIMCEGWGHEVRSASSLALFFSYCFGGIFVFVHAHECQRFPTLANVFVSVLAEETTVQCSWMHKQSLFPFLSHIPPSPPLFLTSKPILSPLSSQYLTCTPHVEQWRSHLLCAILSPLLFSSPLFGYLSYLTPFLPHLSLLHWFVDSCGAEHKSILFITPRCTLHNPNRLFPLTQCKGTHTQTHTHQVGLVRHWIGTHMHPTNK